ncbi:MAG: hypothetical protein E6G92_02010 [Alphaproteobacteria bacterium]|nr:MAG: hypothetical protein E6G92_02010 [Alphaproteobacteria bacterium]
MRGSAAAAGVVSAAILFAPGCGESPQKGQGADDPVRRASFRSLAAKEFLLGCPGGGERPETQRQLERLAELNRFADEKGALQSLQLAANDWAGVGRHDARAPCAPGEAAYRAALADFSDRLDELAAGIGSYRP